jgi:hypothetical protein
MSVHDRAAVRSVKRFDLSIGRYHAGCARWETIEGLTKSQVDAEIRLACETWGYPDDGDGSNGYALIFELR